MSRKPYVREMTSEWVFRHPRYLRYMAREFSCLFIGGFTFVVIWGFKSLSEGPLAWQVFLDCLKHPVSVVFQFIALAFALYHSITWFNLTPKALPLQIGEDFVPDAAIAGAHFGVWAAVSVAILYFAGAF